MAKQRSSNHLSETHVASKAPVLRAVIYARVSSDPYSRGKSVADQVTECKRECRARGWHLAEVFEDNDRSASRYATKERKAYARLVEFLRAGKADVLVTWESSRAQRDLEAYLRLRSIAEENGVRWSYKGRLYDFSRTDDRFSTGLDALLAEREASEIRERVLRGHRASAEKGLPVSIPPFGYRREYDPQTKAFVRQVIHEGEAAVVREAARRVAAGEGLTRICRDFNARGIRTARGRDWRAPILRKMVMRPAYIAKREHQGKVIRDGVWPPILDETTYYACVRLLSDPTRKRERRARNVHLLSGIALCGVCEVPAIAKTRGENHGKHLDYKCGAPSLAVRPASCISIVKSSVDDYVTSLVCERLSRPDAADLLKQDQPDAEAHDALTEAAEKRARLDEVYDAVASGELSAAALARIEARLLPEIEAAEKRANTVQVGPVLRDVIRPDIAEVWPLLPLAQQREVIRTLMTIKLLPNAIEPQSAEERREMRKELVQRLSALRRAYGSRGTRGYGERGMSMARLARLANWPYHKVTNAERGTCTPTADEVRLWCRLVGAESEAEELVALIPQRRTGPTDRIQIMWKHEL